MLVNLDFEALRPRKERKRKEKTVLLANGKLDFDKKLELIKKEANNAGARVLKFDTCEKRRSFKAMVF